MDSEISSLLRSLQQSLAGTPWYGLPVYELLRKVPPAIAFKNPGHNGHSPAQLLFHMVNWAEFALKRVQRDQLQDLAWFESHDWDPIDPGTHDWEEGLRRLEAAHESLITTLNGMPDSFLDEQVDFRHYNFRFLLNGLIQHNIYHAAQIAYIAKFFSH
ncbi:MAG: DinB family protein [Sphingobacteriales bacterium]|jgi:uncharacterized damage-inducible protein DinB|nr:DinB family protein [Sphingobacteriales bacterium]OJW32573.1 MAG: hypothetical protein BGO54_19520 [Sphingobacteriales bacterium 46-32]